MKKLILVLFTVLFIGGIQSQTSVMVGPTLLKPFGMQGIYTGFHFGLELGQDDMQTYYGKISFLPGRTFELNNIYTAVAIDQQATTPYQYPIDVREKFNYTMIDLGKRFYFGEGYDSGFSPYGGTSLQLIFNKVKLEVEDYDRTKYEVYGLGKETVGSFFGLFFGLNGGVKNTFYFGTLYADVGMSYALFAIPSNTVASQTTNYKNLLFNFNIGFRKDFY